MENFILLVDAISSIVGLLLVARGLITYYRTGSFEQSWILVFSGLLLPTIIDFATRGIISNITTTFQQSTSGTTWNDYITNAIPDGSASAATTSVFTTWGTTGSTAIWNAITSNYLIAIPIVWCQIVWLLDILRGGDWTTYGMRVGSLMLILAFVAGPMGTPASNLSLQVMSTTLTAVCKGIYSPTNNVATSPGTGPTPWQAFEISTAQSSASLPSTITALSVPILQSVQNQTSQQIWTTITNQNYITTNAINAMGPCIYTPSVDSSSGKTLSVVSAIRPYFYPSVNVLNPFLLEPLSQTWMANNFTNLNGSIKNGSSVIINYIPITQQADTNWLNTQISEQYQTLINNRKDYLSAQIKLLQQDQTLGGTFAITNMQNEFNSLNSFTAPAPLAATPPLMGLLIATIQTTYSNYPQADNIISQHLKTDPGAWGLLTLTPAGSSAWDKGYQSAFQSAINASDGLSMFLSAPQILGALTRPPQSIEGSMAPTPADDSGSIFSKIFYAIGHFVSLVFVSLVQIITDKGIALAVIFLKFIVFLLSPVILALGMMAMSLGFMVVCWAHPIASFMMLFPGRWTIYMDWIKGLIWVMCWAPIITLGVRLAGYSFDMASIVSLISSALNIIPAMDLVNLAAKTTAGAASAGGSTGAFATNFAPGAEIAKLGAALFGLAMIFGAPMIANMVMNPGLQGIASLARTISSIGGVAAGGALAAVGGLAGAAAGAAKGLQGGAGTPVTAAQKGGQSGARMPSGSGAATAADDGPIARSGGILDQIARPMDTAQSARDRREQWAAGIQKEYGLGAGRVAAGLAQFASGIEDHTAGRAEGTLAGVRNMVSANGPTPIAARMSQGVAALSSGDFQGAAGLAQGLGAHITNRDFPNKRGNGGSDKTGSAGIPGSDSTAPLATQPATGGGVLGSASESGKGIGTVRTGQPSGVPADSQFALAYQKGATEGHALRAQRPGFSDIPNPMAKDLMSKAHQNLKNSGAMEPGMDPTMSAVHSANQAMRAALSSGNPQQMLTTSAQWQTLAAQARDNAGAATDPVAVISTIAEGEGLVAAAQGEALQGAIAHGNMHGAVGRSGFPITPGAEHRRAELSKDSESLVDESRKAHAADRPNQSMNMAKVGYIKAIQSQDPTAIASAESRLMEQAAATMGLDQSIPDYQDTMGEAITGLGLIAAQKDLASPIAEESASAQMDAGGSASGLTSSAGASGGSAGASAGSSPIAGGTTSPAYARAVHLAEVGNAALTGIRGSPPADQLQGTITQSRLAVATAFEDASPVAIARSSDLVTAAATHAARLDSALPATAEVQMQAAEALVETAQAQHSAATISMGYATTLESQAEESSDPMQQQVFHGQAAANRTFAQTMTVASGESMRQARAMSLRAVQSAGTRSVIAPSEASQRTLGSIRHRASVINPKAAGSPIPEPANLNPQPLADDAITPKPPASATLVGRRDVEPDQSLEPV